MKKRYISFVLAALLILSVFALSTPKVHAASAMKSSEQLLEIIKQEEGFAKYPYWDNGHWTVGYGTTCPSDKVDYYKKYGITKFWILDNRCIV